MWFIKRPLGPDTPAQRTMGACVSGLVAPDQQHQDFASFEPNAGSLVLLGTQSAGSNSPTLFLCRDRASGWHWFDAVGYFVSDIA